MMTIPFVWRDDFEFVERTSWWVQKDYALSDISPVDLWSDTVQNGRLAFEWMGKNIKQVKNVDYYPGSSRLPIVSAAFKIALQGVLTTEEAYFYPCDITKRGDVIANAWCLAPKFSVWCVDKEKSKVQWFIPDLKPEEIRIDYAERVIFKKDCMNGLNILRLHESPSSLLVSEELRETVTRLGVKGLKLVPSDEAVFGM